jgi:hypothetical protein
MGRTGTNRTRRDWNTVLTLANTAPVLVAVTVACVPQPAPRAAPAPAPAPATAAAGAPRSGTLERGLAADMAAEQAIPWAAGWRLAWTDFQGSPPSAGNEGARTAYGLYFAWSCRGAAFAFQVVAALHPRRSWVKAAVVRDARENPRILRHEQTHFDLTEVYARRMRRHFATLTRPCSRTDAELRAVARQLVEEEKAMQRRYDGETNHGLRDDRQAAWNADVARMLGAAAPYAR